MELINKLFNMKYSGDIMIEREISGEQKLKDIIKAKTLLENIIHSGGIVMNKVRVGIIGLG